MQHYNVVQSKFNTADSSLFYDVYLDKIVSNSMFYLFIVISGHNMKMIMSQNITIIHFYLCS